MSWEDELGRLMTERGPALVGYGYLLTGDVGAAEDLVQDALVRAFTRRRPHDVVSVEAWVRRILLNLYLDAYRRRRRYDQVVPLLVPDEGRDAQDAVVDRADVAAALRHLSPRERACVVLRFYDDLTIAEVAARLGLSTGAVKRYLSDARHRLEPVLGPQPGFATEDVPTISTEVQR